MRSLLSLGCALSLTAPLLGCTPKKPARTPEPLLHVNGKPFVVSVLGAKYTVPGHIDVPDHIDLPGKFVLIFTDHINRCDGYILFETVADSSEHLTYTNGEINDLEKGWKQNQIKVEIVIGEVTMLDAPSRQTRFDLSSGPNSAAAEFVDHHYPAQNLSVISYTFCEEPSFLAQTSKAILGLVNSQRREDDPGNTPSAGSVSEPASKPGASPLAVP
jgi:hypothetical protein